MAVWSGTNCRCVLIDSKTGDETELPTEPLTVTLRADMLRFNAVLGRLRESMGIAAFEATGEAARRLTEQFRSTQGEPDERAAANERANELLEFNLTDEQRREKEESGKFTAVAPSGTRYRIDAGGGDFNVQQLDVDGQPVASLCLDVSGGVPPADKVLVQKLLLEIDEQRFLSVANKKSVGVPTFAYHDYQSHDQFAAWRELNMTPVERGLTGLVYARTGVDYLAIRVRHGEYESHNRYCLTLVDLRNRNELLNYAFFLLPPGRISVARRLFEGTERLIREWQRQHTTQAIHNDQAMSAIAQAALCYYGPGRNWSHFVIRRLRRDDLMGDRVVLHNTARNEDVGSILVTDELMESAENPLESRKQAVEFLCRQYVDCLEMIDPYMPHMGQFVEATALGDDFPRYIRTD